MRLVYHALALGLVLAGTSHPSSGSPALHEELREIRERHQIAGLAAILVDGEKVTAAIYDGVTDWETRRPVTAETQFRIGSITKVFTGLAVMDLVERGQLSLDEPVSRYLGANVIDNPWNQTDPIVVAHLLEHTAGLTDMSRDEFKHAVDPPLPLSAALRFRPQSRVARWRPGVHSSYSNIGAGLAGRIIEVVSEQSYEHFMQERVLKPFGMTSANFLPSESQKTKLATGYDRDAKTVIPYWHMIYRPFGGLNLLPREMAPMINTLINEGALGGRQVIAKKVIERVHEPNTTAAARAGLRYGYGLGIYAHIANGRVVYGHGGDADGYLAHFAYSAETRRGYFVVINAFKGDALREIRRPLERAVTRGASKSTTPAGDVVDHQRWAGTYRSATWRFGAGPSGELVVTADRDGIEIRGQGRQRQYAAVAPGLYRRTGEPVATAAFLEERGTVILQGRFGNYERTAPGGATDR